MIKRKLKILNIMPLPVYPLNNGAAIYTFYRALELAKRGHEIDFITLKDLNDHTNYDEFNKIFHQVEYINKKNKLKSVLSLQPYISSLFTPNKNESQRILNLINNNKYDVAMFEFVYSYPVYKLIGDKLKRSGTKLIYISHNINFIDQYKHYKESKKNIQKIFYYTDFLKIKKIEKKYISKFSLIFSASPKEISFLRILNPSAKIKWLPVVYNIEHSNNITQDDLITKITEIDKYQYKILFVGGRSNSNLVAIKWFVDNVMPIIKKNIKCCFIVVGKNSKDDILNLIKNNSDIFVFSDVSFVGVFYKFSDLVVTPVSNEAGVKIKLIEALKYRKKVVSRPESTYGSGLKNIVPNAENPEEFATKCLDALNNKIEYNSVWQKFNVIYDNNRIIKNLEIEINKLLDA